MTLPITYERVPVRNLIIDPRVQRVLDPRKVAKIRRTGFSPAKLGTLTASKRTNGDLVLLNGQHRREVIIEEAYGEPVMVEVHHGLSLAEEAELFLGLNDQTTPSAAAQFMVRVVAGDKTAQMIDAIVASHDWRVSTTGASGGISAVAALERVYTTAGGTRPEGAYEDLLDQVLTVITRAWGHDRDGVNAIILIGIAQLYGRFGEAIDSAKLISDLQKHNPVELLAKARQMQSLQGGRPPAALAKVLVGIHNNRKRTNLLPEWVWTR